MFVFLWQRYASAVATSTISIKVYLWKIYRNMRRLGGDEVTREWKSVQRIINIFNRFKRHQLTTDNLPMPPLLLLLLLLLSFLFFFIVHISKRSTYLRWRDQEKHFCDFPCFLSPFSLQQQQATATADIVSSRHTIPNATTTSVR